MSFRVLAVVAALASAAALAACGSDDEPVAASGAEAGPDDDQADGADGRDAGQDADQDANGAATGDGTAPTLTVDAPDDLVAGEPVTWRLTITNPTDEDVTYGFPTAQQGEVTLRDGDVERYRWSDGMVFAQALTELTVPAGEEVTVELGGGSLDVEPGDYRLEATLPVSPGPEPVVRDISVSD